LLKLSLLMKRFWVLFIFFFIFLLFLSFKRADKLEKEVVSKKQRTRKVEVSATPTPTPTPKPSPSPSPSPSPLPSPSPSPIRVTNEELNSFFVQYSVFYGVDEQLLKGIAQCESEMNPQAVNGPYAGLFQFTANTWLATRQAMGLDPNPDLRFNPEEAIRTAAYKISVGGLNVWPNCP
jgi:hypothetical protein